MTKKMIIMRGLPGSGKDYLANELYYADDSEYVILSTDDIVSGSDGIYLYSPEYLGMAHKLNQLKCREACKRGIECVIIDNTNTTYKEVKPYSDIAKEFAFSNCFPGWALCLLSFIFCCLFMIPLLLCSKTLGDTVAAVFGGVFFCILGSIIGYHAYKDSWEEV